MALCFLRTLCHRDISPFVFFLWKPACQKCYGIVTVIGVRTTIRYFVTIIIIIMQSQTHTHTGSGCAFLWYANFVFDNYRNRLVLFKLSNKIYTKKVVKQPLGFYVLSISMLYQSDTCCYLLPVFSPLR